MKRYIHIIFCIVFSIAALKAQEPIVYVLPKSAEVRIGNYLKERSKWIPSSDDIVGIYLKTQDNRRQIGIVTAPPNSKSIGENYIVNSNRFVLIEKKLYPLMFDYDFRYGTTTPIEEMGEYGNRDGSILRCLLIYEDIFFDVR